VSVSLPPSFPSPVLSFILVCTFSQLRQGGHPAGESGLALLNEQIEGKYEIFGKIREGGMGAVYKVRHQLLDEIRIVKVVHPPDRGQSAAAERFLREAKAIRLRHPNIALLHDSAVDASVTTFIVMEFIDGWSLLDVPGRMLTELILDFRRVRRPAVSGEPVSSC
jgi:serine/threonine protein kinase